LPNSNRPIAECLNWRMRFPRSCSFKKDSIHGYGCGPFPVGSRPRRAAIIGGHLLGSVDGRTGASQSESWAVPRRKVGCSHTFLARGWINEVRLLARLNAFFIRLSRNTTHKSCEYSGEHCNEYASAREAAPSDRRSADPPRLPRFAHQTDLPQFEELIDQIADLFFLAAAHVQKLDSYGSCVEPSHLCSQAKPEVACRQLDFKYLF